MTTRQIFQASQAPWIHETGQRQGMDYGAPDIPPLLFVLLVISTTTVCANVCWFLPGSRLFHLKESPVKSPPKKTVPSPLGSGWGPWVVPLGSGAPRPHPGSAAGEPHAREPASASLCGQLLELRQLWTKIDFTQDVNLAAGFALCVVSQTNYGFHTGWAASGYWTPAPKF